MMRLPRDSEAALEPLNTALAAAAQSRVSAFEVSARDAATQAQEAAARDRDKLVAEATAAGKHDAEAAAALASARIRRTANELVLAQQEEIRAELRDRVRAESLALRNDPAYPTMLKNLTKRARRLLGAGATVTVSEDGGVTAVARSRRIDLTLPTLAAAKFDELTEEMGSVWRS